MTSLYPVRDIKLVKESFIVTDDVNDVHVFHYDTCILSANTITGRIHSINRYSVTSSKLINRVIQHYYLDNKQRIYHT